MSRPVRTLALVAVLALGAGACGSGSSSDEGAATTVATTAPEVGTADPTGPATSAGETATTADEGGGDTTQAPATTPAPVPELLRYAGPTVSDGDLDLAAYAGQPVAFWFWAPG